MKTITATNQQYTKHYYIEGQRIASKIGGGFLNASVHTITDKLKLMDAKKTGIKDYEHFGEKLWAMLERQFECVEQKSGYVEYDGRLDNIIDLAEADAPEEQQYFYHPDHLGSSSFITDASGDAHQHLQYLPFGEDFISQRIDWQTRYNFSAKEKDKNTGYHYFGARYYDSEVSVWLSVDPMADKYPGLSPYMYAEGNPVMLVDPDGMATIARRDEWEINKKGEVTNHIKTDKHDAFFMVDKDGNRIDGKFVKFEYGTIENAKSLKAGYKKRVKKDGKTLKIDAVTDVDIYKVRGDENSTELFEFYTDNTNVEWSHFKTGNSGEKGLNFISTGHIEYTEPGATALINGQLGFGYTIRDFTHSHPKQYSVKLASIPSESDINIAKALENYYKSSYPKRVSKPTFHLYIPHNGKRIEFNGKSKQKDFLPK